VNNTCYLMSNAWCI